MTMMALASVAAPVIGGVLGQNQAASAAKQAEDAQKRAAAALANIQLPDIEKMKLALEEFAITGQYNPLVEQALALGPSAFENINIDPRLRQNQMTALQAVADKAQSGLSQSDLAGFELARRNSAAGEQSRQQQILQNLAQRGQGGSGAEIALRAISSQEAADRQSLEDLDMAGKQEQARLAALQAMSQMSGSLRGQEYGEQTNLAQARDAMEKFNLANSQDINQRNVLSRNQAQQQNLANQQRIAESNVGLRNQQQMSNKGLLQQNFQNEIQRAGGVARANQGLANMYDQQASNTQAGYSNIGNAVGTGLGAFSQMGGASKPTVDAAGGTTSFSRDYLKRP